MQDTGKVQGDALDLGEDYDDDEDEDDVEGEEDDGAGVEVIDSHDTGDEFNQQQDPYN